VQGHDVRRWMVWLLGLYSDAYASNQYRALQQFFKWLAEEEDLPDPMARMHLSSPAFSGLANLRLSYAVAFISRYSSMASCGVRYPIAE
jgi:hypothetical protein